MKAQTHNRPGEAAALKSALRGVKIDLGGFNFAPKTIQSQRSEQLSLEEYALKAHGITPAAHHLVWIEKIQAIIDGKTDRRRLLLIAPPGTAKSTYTSLLLPPYYLGKHPDHNIIAVTSSDIQARQFLGAVKNTLDSHDKHRRIYGDPGCRPDTRRGWSNDGLYLAGTPPTSKDPAYRCVGFNASVIGSRCHGLILDDPLTQQEAQSLIEQKTAKDVLNGTLIPRLHPDGWIIAIMTRWHETDMAAMLIERGDFDVVHMPAILEEGTDEEHSLWPERFTLDFYKELRGADPSIFGCVYQGDPSAIGGDIFKDAMFLDLPEGFDPMAHPRVQFWDLAYGKTDTSDFTVGVTVAVDAGKVYVVDVVRKRPNEAETVDLMCESLAKWRPELWGVELSAYRQRYVQDILALVNARTYRSGIPIQPSVDKVVRARVVTLKGNSGTLYADRKAAWWPLFINELKAFDLGAHDDQVDAVAGAVQLVQEHMAHTIPAGTTTPYKIGKATGTPKKDMDWGLGVAPPKVEVPTLTLDLDRSGRGPLAIQRLIDKAKKELGLE